MKQIATTVIGDATAHAAIAFITQWAGKYSFLLIHYHSWNISITNDKTYKLELDFDVSYAIENSATAKQVIQYLRNKSMITDGINDNGRYLYKKGALLEKITVSH